MCSEKSGSTSSGGAGFSHIPVLLEETIDALNLRADKTYVDVTAGAGGHLLAMQERLGIRDDEKTTDPSQTKLIGIDRDKNSLDKLQTIVSPSVKLLHGNYSNMRKMLTEYGVNTISGGILADLGVSSMQLDEPERGFSFLRDGPLDMRMDSSQHVTAEQLINNLSEQELAEIIFKYGEERHSRLIARNIVKARPLRTTLELAEIVRWSLYRGPRKGAPRDTSHPATRTFQAIRIAVNNELESLETFLSDAIEMLEEGARLCVITFHSLEDRIVKQILRRAAADCVCPPGLPICTCQHQKKLLIITRKPVIAGEKEVLANIRSRSAKLRTGEKLGRS